MFEHARSRGVDHILALMQEFRADPRDQKVDLVVGVYKDAQGNVPIMRAVKSAEARLLRDETTKMYVGMSGDAGYCQHVQKLLFGSQAPALRDDRVVSFQTPGGSGALKVGCDFLNGLESGKRLWVSDPTWANHQPVAMDAGLTIAVYPFFRPSDRGLDFDAMMVHLQEHARSGDALLLHACCHNPTGVDLSPEQWSVVTDFVVERGVLPFVDCAYQGFGDGLESDVDGLRHLAAHVPELAIASSFSKNFGIYRERTGALTVMTRRAADVANVKAAIETVIRSNYSMPPSHGARVVATVLDDVELRATWAEELDQMRIRIASMRQDLRRALEDRQITVDASFLTDQRGMFSYTGMTPEMVETLKQSFAIYAAGDGRINIAALSAQNIDHVADGIAHVFAQR